MNELNRITDKGRLFTYKVAFDGGNAPNPYGDVCTLAICKPKIRSVAKEGDVIVGFGCKNDNELRIVYCMVVKESLTWDEYIKRCGSNGSDAIKEKIPKSEKHQGDCIWRDPENYGKARASWSGHGGSEDFERDVKNGKNVLVGDVFWYFGKGDKHRIEITDDKLASIIPRAQGHRSNANMRFRDTFVEFFNEQLIKNKITKSGLWGTPSIPPEATDDRACLTCCAAEKESDQSGEEFD